MLICLSRLILTMLFAFALILKAVAQPAPAAAGPVVDLPLPVPVPVPDNTSGSTPVNPGAPDDTELAKQLQNPISDLVSIPFQNNTNFNYGPHQGTQDILNIQPVVPFKLNDYWSVITRTILPLIWQPSLQPSQTVPFGLGPTTVSAFLTPKHSFGGWVLGAGPVVQLPTISSATLGSNVWGGGPGVVAVHVGGKFVYGALVNNVFSFGGTSGPAGTRYNSFTFNPFINYNFGQGWFIGTVPIITANWLTSGDKAWTLPVGAQAGRLIKLGGKLPVNLVVGAYYNALRPQYGSTWQLRTQVAFIF